MLIAHEVPSSQLTDQLAQYATLKAMGYANLFVIRIALQQALFYALVAYVPAWSLCFVLFGFIAKYVWFRCA